MRIIISGASGFVGGALAAHLRQSGVEVTRLVRRPPTDPTTEHQWDPAYGSLDPAVISDADAIINLNGRNISRGRWSARVKDELRSSRLNATRTIVAAIHRSNSPPPVLINASATGYYGDRGDEILDEESDPGVGFLADLSCEWEAVALGTQSEATRVVLLRLGMVLGNGGALGKMLLPFKLGFGGPVGSGNQWWPWIAMTDVIGAVDHILARGDLTGPVNLVAPEAVTSRSFARALGENLGRPAIVPAPAFAVKLALGEMAQALLLASTKVRPKVLEKSGYVFKAPTLAEAFRVVLG
jgi:hypothetical protein